MNKKIILLILGIIFDGIGYLTFALPVLGEFGDLVWAPLSAFFMFLMYKNKNGVAIATIGEFVEEILPFTDFIPSFTLMWIYTYFIRKETTPKVVK